MHSVAVLVGSLRRDSINKKLAHALAKLASGKLEFRFLEIGDLPLYNDDLWASPPASVLRFKEQLAKADAVLFVSPEYNRGVTAALKNAIDWGTRPWGQNSWAGKPLGLAGASLGAIGTAVAQANVRSTMVVLDALVMGQPELYLAYKEGLVNDQHDVTDETTRKFLTMYVEKFAAWIQKQKG